MRSARWRWGTPEETKKFRNRQRLNDGHFDALALENKGIYTIIEGSVHGIDGPVPLQPGTEIKVISDDDPVRYADENWVYLVVSASVRYGDRVESLKPDTSVAILSEPSDT